ncbi:type II toxin-antitoxin system prevent-host-death family antitoxin [Candidatus Dojkabacteria bacterium]|nr:type II toxin-antitoxin system prevent-host-death family antitoxin [Candidatus Dojkabacteria bacterium]
MLYNMASQYTSTDLKQNTRQILENVEQSKEPAIIHTYNKPRVVILEYDEWKKSTERLRNKDLKKYMFDFEKKDTTKMFRKMRNEEVNS